MTKKIKFSNPENIFDNLKLLTDTLINGSYIKDNSQPITDVTDDSFELQLDRVDEELPLILSNYGMVEYFDETQESKVIGVIYIYKDIYTTEKWSESDLVPKLEDLTKEGAKIVLVTRDLSLLDNYKKEDKSTLKNIKFIRK